MGRYLMTHSLLSSWLYTMKGNPYEDMTCLLYTSLFVKDGLLCCADVYRHIVAHRKKIV